MRRLLGVCASILLVLGGGTTAVAEITAKLPAPDLRGLLPFAAMPLDKPPIPLPAVTLPVPPQDLPELPPPRFITDPANRPIPPIPSPRLLACNPLGSVLRVSTELLECGRARYQRKEYEEARKALEGAIQESSDRRVLQEARYWLAETLLYLGRVNEVEPLFLLVVQDDPRSEFGMYAADELGWVTLGRGDPARALTYFDGLLKLPIPPQLLVYARHGRAMSLYGLKRYADAREEWVRLVSAANTPRPLAAEATFWLGDTLGRLGDYKGAIARLQPSASGGPPQFAESGVLRYGWWSRAAGQPADAVRSYRNLLGAYPRASEVPWARLGLVQALLDQDDYAAAREEARQLETADGGKLALPAWLLIRRWLADKSRPDDARPLDEELLARNLDPSTRAWVLLMSAELARQSGQSDEARNRYELVRQAPGVPALSSLAALRLAQLDFDIREFARAEAGAKSLLDEKLPADVRLVALLLAGEAAYWARDYADAAAYYTRVLDAEPKHPLAPQVGLSLGWAEFRRGRLDVARQRWSDFVAEAPTDSHAAEALLLSAELAIKAGDLASAQRLLGEVIVKFPNSEQAQVAILNRAIMAINYERPAEALPELTMLVQRAPLSPYIGRARAAKGIAQVALGRPAEAQPDFRAALGQGEDALAHLGLGVIALEQSDWESATREFAEARDAGGGALAATAEYGLAVAAFNQRKIDTFKGFAASLMGRPVDLRITPNLLYGMDAVAIDEKRWVEARDLAFRLMNEFPRHPAAAAALADVGAAAGADGQWPLAREMYETLGRRYPGHPARASGRLVYGEALLRTGLPADARRELEAFVKDSPNDPRIPRALVLLAETQEAAGNRAAALQIYERIDREFPNAREEGSTQLGAAKLLMLDGRWPEARPMLERALNGSDPGLATEAAYRLGEGFRAAGQNEDAVDAYMTAAYLAPDSSWARRALLGAGQSFTALKQNDSAIIVYRKLLAASNVDPDLAAAARTRLKALGVN